MNYSFKLYKSEVGTETWISETDPNLNFWKDKKLWTQISASHIDVGVEESHHLIIIIPEALYVIGATLNLVNTNLSGIFTISLLFYSCCKMNYFICTVLSTQVPSVAQRRRIGSVCTDKKLWQGPASWAVLPTITIQGMTYSNIAELCLSSAWMRINSRHHLTELSVQHREGAAPCTLLGLQQGALISVCASNVPNPSDLYFTVLVSNPAMKSACNQGCQ